MEDEFLQQYDSKTEVGYYLFKEYLKNVYCIIAIKFYLVLATFKFL